VGWPPRPVVVFVRRRQQRHRAPCPDPLHHSELERTDVAASTFLSARRARRSPCTRSPTSRGLASRCISSRGCLRRGLESARLLAQLLALMRPPVLSLGTYPSIIRHGSYRSTSSFDGIRTFFSSSFCLEQAFFSGSVNLLRAFRVDLFHSVCYLLHCLINNQSQYS
jgi:hypothetical protein